MFINETNIQEQIMGNFRL